jgi:hypothetical protein
MPRRAGAAAVPDMAGKLRFVQLFLRRRKVQIGEYVAAALRYGMYLALGLLTIAGNPLSLA